MIYIISILWVLCGVQHYRIVRSGHRRLYLLWTVTDRALWGFAGLLGPLALIVSFVVYGKHSDKPAKW